MKLLVIALFFAFCIFANAQSVLDLNKDNFESTIKENEFVLNMFYAPWCGHCKTLKPVFDEVATQVAGKYVLAKVDCTVENDLCSSHNVRGYPTVAFFKNGNKKEYDGPRTTEGIIAWLDKKSGPVAVELTTAESINEFSNTNNVVAYFSQKNDAFKAYLVAAEDSRLAEMKFAFVSDSSLFNGNVDGSVVYFTKDGQQVVQEENLATAEALANFLFDSTFPVFQEIDANNFKNYASRGKKLLLAWIKTKGENAQQEIDVIGKFATQYPQFSFGYISHENFGPNMDRMGASGKVVPAITLLSFTDNKPIVFEGEWNEESVKEWIEGVISGKYKYASKSEPIPETQGNVVTLVGKNFDEIVHDTNKDVLVEFYAPWCGHCKNLVPEYEALGNLFSAVDDVVIAKIDLTANDVDTSHFEVKGFPTILLYKRDAKTAPLQFQGARDAKSIAAWIKDNSASEAAKTISHDEL